MDQGDWMGIGTLSMVVAFIAIVRWAWSNKRRVDFDEAARLPFADDTDATKRESGR